MKKLFLWISLISLFACGGLEERSRQDREWMNGAGKLKILSTTAMINDLVQHIAEGHGLMAVLIQGNLDPHSYQLVKGDDEKLKAADLIFSKFAASFGKQSKDDRFGKRNPKTKP
jgi:manganese/zinc/iron transport system substrate-binding protein